MTGTIERIIDLAIQIQQIPAPTFHEANRAKFVRKLLEHEGLKDVTIDEAGNVFGLWLQKESQRSKPKPLIVSAHLDTVFPSDLDLSIEQESDKVYGIGIGDNSLGVAALFGLIWMLRERNVELDGNVWLVANVCEEGLGDLRGMKAIVNRFGSDVLAYLVLEGMALGHVYHKAVGVKRYRITARTPGGHSWSDYGQPSAVVELSKLVLGLNAFSLPSKPRTTMNVGKIRGGTSINVIPSEAWMELDLRSEGQDELAALVKDVERLIESAGRQGVEVDSEVIGARPAGKISAGHPLIKLAQDCLHEQGLDAVLTSGSTDANVPLSKGYPALVLGVTKGGGAHTKDEYIEIPPIKNGMEQLIKFVCDVWRF